MKKEIKLNKDFVISDDSVKVEDRLTGRYKFTDISIEYILDSDSFVIRYNKNVSNPSQKEVDVLDENGMPTGATQLVDDVQWKFINRQSEPITREQYEQIETIIKANIDAELSTTELLSAVVFNGIPKFISMYGYYGGVQESDFEKVEIPE